MASTDDRLPIVDSNSNCTTTNAMLIPEDSTQINPNSDLSITKCVASPSSENEVKKIEGTSSSKEANVKTVSPTSSTSKGGKTVDREVFVPAPPPATNAWAKRMQPQGNTSTSSQVAKAGNDGKQNADQSVAAGHQVVDRTGQSHAAATSKSDKPVHPDPSGAAVNVTGDDRKQLSNEVGKPVKGKGEARPRIASGEMAVPAVNTDSPDHKELNVVKTHAGSSEKTKSASVKEDSKVGSDGADKAGSNMSPKAGQATKEPSSANVMTGRSEEWRGWEKNTAHTTGKNSSGKSKETDLKDSGDWPSLQKADQGLKNVPNKDPGQNSSDSNEQSALTASVEGDNEQIISSPTLEGEDVNCTYETASVAHNHNPPLSDSGIEELPSKDAPGSDQSKPKKKGKGNKQKWLPVEIELPKTRRRRGTGRTRTDSREGQDVGAREASTSHRDTARVDAGQVSRENERENFPRDYGRRAPRGGRENTFRRNRHDTPTDRNASSGETKSGTSAVADEGSPSRVRESRPPGNTASSTGPTGRMGYQGSRRAAYRGRAGASGYPYAGGRGRYSQYSQAVSPYPFMEFGIFDTQYQYYSVEPTYFVPIVSQSDYYTSILADDGAKKLIAQQIEYYFSTENLLKDFFLRRQMDSDGWISVELLASFRRVRIHTGTVNVELIVESMADSKIVEISSDRLQMRAREDPGKWSLKGVEPTTYSKLSIDVPEFVPGQAFKLPLSSPIANWPTTDNASPVDSLKTLDSQRCQASPSRKAEVSVTNLSSERSQIESATGVSATTMRGEGLDANEACQSTTNRPDAEVISVKSDTMSVESSPSRSAASETVDSDTTTQSSREENKRAPDDITSSTSDK